jgi:integrase
VDDLWTVCCAMYFPQRLRIRSDLTRRQYQFAVDNLAAMLGRAASIADLTDETLIRLCHFLDSQGLAAKTINERVGRLKTLANWLWRRGEISRGPTVEKIPEPIRTPRAWNRAQLEALFAAAAAMPGRVCQFRAAVWWSAFLSVAWFTGERTHALLALRWEWLDADVLHVPAEVRKGGRKDGLYILPAECLARLVPLSSAGKLIFPWHLTECSFYLHYDRLLRLAGLPTGRAQKVQKIRRSHATWLREAGGDPTRSLLHDSQETTIRHYLDPSICRQPPRLFDPGGNGAG